MASKLASFMGDHHTEKSAHPANFVAFPRDKLPADVNPGLYESATSFATPSSTTSAP